MRTLAFDIGGANLKLATSDSQSAESLALSQEFPLWKSPERLAAALSELLRQAVRPGEPYRVVATMTGELCDCFASKAAGVATIVTAMQQASASAEGTSASQPPLFYSTRGEFLAPQQACEQWQLVAAANWHALASFTGRFLPGGSGLLVDIGSTTCDIIPLAEGRVVSHGTTDPQRLASGELVYTGVVRSPVCGLVSHLPWRGEAVAVAHEWFATSGDAYLLLGMLPEQPDNLHTADGRPATYEAAWGRLARMICADRQDFSLDDARAAATAIATAQHRRLAEALHRVASRSHPARVPALVVSGQGEFLAYQVAQAVLPTVPIIALRERLGADVSRVAPAYAVATLAQEQLG